MNDLKKGDVFALRKNENIVGRKIHDTYFLINIAEKIASDKCFLYEINEIGYFIWENINGQHTCSDLAMLLKDALIADIEYEKVYEDVFSFLEQLKSKGIVVLDG